LACSVDRHGADCVVKGNGLIGPTTKLSMIQRRVTATLLTRASWSAEA
jgi:hypothetical protein